MTNYKDFLNEQLQNEEFKKEYDAVELEVKTIKELCEKYNLKQIELSRRFEIPIRTVQDWHREVRTPSNML